MSFGCASVSKQRTRGPSDLYSATLQTSFATPEAGAWAFTRWTAPAGAPVPMRQSQSPTDALCETPRTPGPVVKLKRASGA